MVELGSRDWIRIVIDMNLTINSKILQEKSDLSLEKKHYI